MEKSQLIQLFFVLFIAFSSLIVAATDSEQAQGEQQFSDVPQPDNSNEQDAEELPAQEITVKHGKTKADKKNEMAIRKSSPYLSHDRSNYARLLNRFICEEVIQKSGFKESSFSIVNDNHWYFKIHRAIEDGQITVDWRPKSEYTRNTNAAVRRIIFFDEDGTIISDENHWNGGSFQVPLYSENVYWKMQRQGARALSGDLVISQGLSLTSVLRQRTIHSLHLEFLEELKSSKSVRMTSAFKKFARANIEPALEYVVDVGCSEFK